MTSWGPPNVSNDTAQAGVNVIALVTEKQEIVTAVAAKLSTSSRLFLQRLRVDDTVFDAERLAKETLGESSSIVCYGPDVPLELALATAAIIDRDHPDVSQIVITAPTGDVWREALRTGIRELVSPSALDDELEGALTRSIERAARLRDQRSIATTAPTRGKVIVVLSPKGGSGKTMLTSNLSVAHRPGRAR
jgi:pilus assembly protein CpaE